MKEGIDIQSFIPTHTFSALQLESWVTATVETSYGIEATLMAGVGLLTLVDVCGTTQILDTLRALPEQVWLSSAQNCLLFSHFVQENAHRTQSQEC